MHVSARVDYALRALLVLAGAPGGLVKGESIATGQAIPVKFCENILGDLRRARLVTSQRGADGGYRLARDAATVTLGDVIRAIDGPLAEVRGVGAETTSYAGDAARLQDVWVAVRASLRSVLDCVTLADIVRGELPPQVQALVDDPASWQRRY